MKKLICFALVAIVLMSSLCSCGTVFKYDEEQTIATDVKTEAKITLDTYTATLSAGSTLQLQATADANVSFKWKSSDESVALVNSQGTVTAVSEGVANITCYADNAVEAVCTVTVAKAGSDTPTKSQKVTTGDFIFPHSSSAYLTEEEISIRLSAMTGESPSGKYAQDAINEIYARNGYVFKKANTSSYYNAQSWYTPNENFSTADFNDYEKKNIALLQKFL